MGIERFRPDIEAMLDERFYPMWWVEQGIADGSIAVFENEEALIAVEKRIYPGGAVELHCMFAVGDIKAIKELEKKVVSAGVVAGCDLAVIDSRPGWERVFYDQGYRKERVRLVKDLQNGN